MSPMAPEERKKLYLLLGLVGVLVVILLLVIQPWKMGGAPQSEMPITGVPSSSGSFAGMNQPPGGDPEAPVAPMIGPSSAMPTMGGVGSLQPAVAGGGDGGAASPQLAKGPPIERHRIDPMAPFTTPPPPPSLAPVFTAARPQWTGQGLEGIPQIRLSDFNPQPRIPGERPEGIPNVKASAPIDEGDKRLAGFMMTNANMMWVIMEVVETAGMRYYVLKPGDLVQVQGTSYQIVRLERFRDKDDDKDKVRAVLKDRETQGERFVVLRPSPQPQQQMGGGMMGGQGGMGIPGMPMMPGMGGPGGMMGGDGYDPYGR